VSRGESITPTPDDRHPHQAEWTNTTDLTYCLVVECRLLSIQHFLETLATRYTVARSNAPTVSTPSLHASASAASFVPAVVPPLSLVSPRFHAAPDDLASSAATSVSSDPPPADRPALVASWLELKNWFSFLARELTSFHLRNAILEDQLSELIPCMPHLRSLDLSAGGYGKSLGSSLGKGLKSSSHTLVGLDVARCSFGVEGIRAICQLIQEHHTQPKRGKFDPPDHTARQVEMDPNTPQQGTSQTALPQLTKLQRQWDIWHALHFTHPGIQGRDLTIHLHVYVCVVCV
jgi:hypothetical protein